MENGRLAQRESTTLTSWGSLVQSQYRPPLNTKDLYGIFYKAKFLFLNNCFFSNIISIFVLKIYSPYSKKSNREKEQKLIKKFS